VKKTASLVLSFSLLFVTLILSGCARSEGFAIYLTKDNIRPSQMPILSHVDLAESPIISEGDIISYDKNTHEVEISADAFERIKQTDKNYLGESFVVCVDKQPIYWGAFWSGLSSQSFEGVTIIRPLQSLHDNQFVITIGLGYPSWIFFQGVDPRSNPVILKSLEQAGKLK
jgi:hypothetical protein